MSKILQEIILKKTTTTRTKMFPSTKYCFLKTKRQRNKKVSGMHNYYTSEGIIMLPTFNSYFMFTQDSAEELNQNDDDISCLNGVTVINRKLFFYS